MSNFKDFLKEQLENPEFRKEYDALQPEMTVVQEKIDTNIAYRTLKNQLESLIENSPSLVSGLANASALIYGALSDINWAGFYLMQDGKLVLGPFQGKPACVEIAVGRGVCGTAVETQRTQLVPDVHAFPGHIACDADSQSEIVVPIFSADSVIAVLDIDSPIKNRFTEKDKQGLESLAKVIETELF